MSKFISEIQCSELLAAIAVWRIDTEWRDCQNICTTGCTGAKGQ